MLRKGTSPVLALAALVSALLLGACNTLEGLGEDTQAAGEALEDTAEENQ